MNNSPIFLFEALDLGVSGPFFGARDRWPCGFIVTGLCSTAVIAMLFILMFILTLRP